MVKFIRVESKSLEKENFCHVFTYSKKWASEITIMFHVAVVQGWLRNEQKSMMHVQSCCFSYHFLAILIAIPVVLALAPCSCDPEILQL